MRVDSARERLDLLALGLATLIVPATWWLLLGWSWPLSVAGHDELAQNLLLIKEISEAGRGRSSLVYRPDLLGGFVGRDLIGPFPLFSLLASLGAQPVAVSVLSAFAVQTLLGFLSWRATADATRIWAGEARPSPLAWLGTVWLQTFAPFLSWRLGYGHLNLVAGLLPFAAGLALVLATASKRSSFTLTAVSGLSMTLGLLHSGQQIVLYSLVFGGPLLLGTWLSFSGEWRRLAKPLLATGGAFLLSLPSLWPMFVTARSSDAPRGLAGQVVTYDVVTSSGSDWLTSIPWTRSSVPATRDPSLHHEINYPLGPLVLLLALVPWRRARALGAGLLVSLAAVLVFSMDVTPLSRVLLDLVPLLKSFRVPARSSLPWLFLLPILASAALLAGEGPSQKGQPSPKSSRRKKRVGKEEGWRVPSEAIGGLALGALFFLAPTLLREVGSWLLATIAVLLTLKGRRPSAVLVLLALGASSVAAFRERLLPFEDGGARLTEAQEIGRALQKARPELSSALSRVALDLEIPSFTVNTAFAAGLSSLDGYEVPTRRFLALVSSLRAIRYEPTAVFFSFKGDSQAFPVLRQLYNVGLEVALPSRGSLSLTELGPTAGPAWFSSSVIRLEGPEALGEALKSPGDALYLRLKDVLWMDGRDPLGGRAGDSSSVDPRCREARVTKVSALPRSGEIEAEVATDADCPLTFATNFAETLEGTAYFLSENPRRISVFPAYGALSGVTVPKGAQRVSLVAVPPHLEWGWLSIALGVGLLLAGAPLSKTGGQGP